MLWFYLGIVKNHELKMLFCCRIMKMLMLFINYAFVFNSKLLSVSENWNHDANIKQNGKYLFSRFCEGFILIGAKKYLNIL